MSEEKEEKIKKKKGKAEKLKNRYPAKSSSRKWFTTHPAHLEKKCDWLRQEAQAKSNGFNSQPYHCNATLGSSLCLSFLENRDINLKVEMILL